MQLSPVYLYLNKIDVYTNSLDSWVGGYRKVYQRNLKIYRGVDNKIDLQIRNGDEKAVDLSQDQSVVFRLIAKGTQEHLLSKDCQDVDDSSRTRGRVYVTLTESDLLDLEPGYYQYTTTIETRSSINVDEYTVTSRIPLYVDSQYGIVGTIEVSGDIAGKLPESTVIDVFSKYNDDDGTSYYISSIIDANPNTSTPASQHTFQFYSTGYAGNVQIQGSISPGSNPNVWVDIPDSAFDVGTNNFDPTTTQYVNIVGKWNWFRIRHTPTAGTIDKALYR